MTKAVSATEPGATVPNALDEEAEEPAHRRAARYVWALLLARIYEVLPLRLPEVRRRPADHRLHQRRSGDSRNSRPLGRANLSATSGAARGPPLWALPVDRSGRAGNRPAGPAGTGLRIRPARRLVGTQKRQGLRLVAGWLMVPPGRVRFPGEFSRFSRLTWSEKRGDTYLGGVEFPILFLHLLFWIRTHEAIEMTTIPDGAAQDWGGRIAATGQASFWQSWAMPGGVWRLRV